MLKGAGSTSRHYFGFSYLPGEEHHLDFKDDLQTLEGAGKSSFVKLIQLIYAFHFKKMQG